MNRASDGQKALAIRYAVRSDTGLVRERNEDVAYAGPRLLAVADGFGGSELASAAAIEALKPLDTANTGTEAGGVPAGDLLNALDAAVRQAHRAVHEINRSRPSPHGIGTTLTAMLLSGSRLALVHIGDSRAYLLRDGELFQITEDHTLVRSLVEEGRITPEEAASHPQRSLLLRALDGRDEPDSDLNLHDVRPGDRYLLCSDGLPAVVPTARVQGALATIPDPERAAQELIDLANGGGGPDNVTCVVADVVQVNGETTAA